MLGGSAVPLTLSGALVAIFAGYMAESAEPFFPASLETRTVPCPESSSWVPNIPVLDDYEAAWFASELRGLKERPLYPVATGKQTLRFTWLRSFHSQVSVRVETLPDGSAHLHAVRGPQIRGATERGERGCGATDSVCTLTRPLSAAETSRLEAASKAVFAAAPNDCRLGTDGARWIIEEAENGQYSFAQRWSPQSGPVRDLGLVMLGMTGWTFADIY